MMRLPNPFYYMANESIADLLAFDARALNERVSELRRYL